jgi:hypothetical protein
MTFWKKPVIPILPDHRLENKVENRPENKLESPPVTPLEHMKTCIIEKYNYTCPFAQYGLLSTTGEHVYPTTDSFGKSVLLALEERNEDLILKLALNNTDFIKSESIAFKGYMSGRPAWRESYSGHIKVYAVYRALKELGIDLQKLKTQSIPKM